MSRYQRPTTPEDQPAQEAARQEKLAELHQQLQDGVRCLRTSDDWTAWLQLASSLHDYSFNNILLILDQRPDATAVAGYRAWQDLGRQVDKGQKGIRILAPVVRRPRTDETSTPDDDAAATAKVVGYRVTHVWDVAQTGGEPLPQKPVPHLLSGQAPEGLWESLALRVHAQGFQLTRGACGEANGVTNFVDRTVRVRADVDDAQAVKTLAHELGHVLLHTPKPGVPVIACRGTIEVEAESVAYLVTAAHGLSSDSYTFPYVRTWASAVPDRQAEDVVSDVGRRVVRTARDILDLLSPVDARLVSTVAARAAVSASQTASRRTSAVALAERVAGPAAAQLREGLLAVHADAADFFVARRDASWVPDYLHSRALGASLAPGAPWQIGYAPNSWTALTQHLRQAGYSDQTLEASGLSLRTRNGHLVDRFRDRLMFSVRDDEGRTVGFVGRARPGADDRTPKYLNSPTTALYRKGEQLFGLSESVSAFRAEAVLTVTEGTLDAIAVHLATSGRNAGVALCGTALTAERAASLAAVAGRPGTRVVVATDPDAAGRAAAETAYVRLTAVGLAPWTPDLPPGLDPADLMRAHGARRLEAALTVGARPLVDVLVEHRVAQWSDRLQWVEGGVGAVRAVAPLLSGLDAEDQQRLTRRVVDLTGLSPTTVAHEIAAVAQRSREEVAPPTGSPSQVSASKRPLPTGQSGRPPVHSAALHR